MAPIKKRTTARARAAKAIDQRGKYAPPAEQDNAPTPSAARTDDPFSFKLSKQDKRTIKHNSLMHKVREAGISKQKKPLRRRRRPGKKMKGEDLGSLGEALGEVEWEDEESADIGAKAGGGPSGEGKMKMKSFRTRPGAMKRKAKMEGLEVERFGRNLAQLVGSGKKEESAGQADRWTALRAFIGSTMEKDKAFT